MTSERQQEVRLPFTSSYHSPSDFTIFRADWYPAKTIGFEADDPLGRGRGWFTPDEARAVAAELVRRADEIDAGR